MDKYHEQHPQLHLADRDLGKGSPGWRKRFWHENTVLGRYHTSIVEQENPPNSNVRNRSFGDLGPDFHELSCTLLMQLEEIRRNLAPNIAQTPING